MTALDRRSNSDRYEVTTPRSGQSSGEDRDVGHRRGDRVVGELVVDHLAGEVLLVGRQVEVAVAAQGGEDDLGLAGLLARQRLADGGGDGVGRLGRRDDPLGAGELHRGGEALGLRDGHRLDEARLVEVRHQRRHAVVAQPAGVDRLGDEAVAERVHLQQRRHPGGVAEVVAVLTLGEARAGGRLDAADRRVDPPGELLAQEREREPAEVRAAAGAADEQVGRLADLGQLQQRLLADDRLVQQHVVEHAAEGVPGVGIGGGHRHRLGDGDAEAAGVVGVLGEQRRARTR